MWLRPTPTQSPSVFEQNAIMLVSLIFCKVCVLAVFARPVAEIIQKYRRRKYPISSWSPAT